LRGRVPEQGERRQFGRSVVARPFNAEGL
jgi:hypothetical protein